jgi:hypothetical protein
MVHRGFFHLFEGTFSFFLGVADGGAYFALGLVLATLGTLGSKVL